MTEVITDGLARGWNAVDAAIAGAVAQSVIQPEMTNWAGSVHALIWIEADQQLYELNSSGVIAADRAPHRPIPMGRGFLSQWPRSPMAVIPGFMPAMKAMYGRFGAIPWAELCAPAVQQAEAGVEVTPFQYRMLVSDGPFFGYTDSGRRYLFSGGDLPAIGTTWHRPDIERTARRIAANGPDEMISGEWAAEFVATACQQGWNITIEDMSAVPPRWGAGRSFDYAGRRIVQLGAPERQAAFDALTLGVVNELVDGSMGHYMEDPLTLYYFAHAMRRATIDVGMVHDPAVFADPTAVLMDRDYHQHLARLIKSSTPRSDLTNHVRLARATNGFKHALEPRPEPPAGSCESTIIDMHGNWVQMMNTMQGSGIPGEVIGGVPMVGSHATTALSSDMCGWLTGGGRTRTVIGSTMIFEDDRPVMSLGSPASGCRSVPLMLFNLLHADWDPQRAEEAPRFLAIDDDYSIRAEARLSDDVVIGLARLGVTVEPIEPFDYSMGSFQMGWRQPDGFGAIAGRRREGYAAGLNGSPETRAEG